MTALAASTYVPSECSLSPADVTHARMAPPDAVAEARAEKGGAGVTHVLLKRPS